MPVTTITAKSDFDNLLTTHPHVILQATASWCGPCKAITPLYNKHSDDAGATSVSDALAFARFDTDDVPDLAFELGVRTIPAFFVFEKGEKVDGLAGANPPALKKAVDGLVEKAKGGAGAEAKPAGESTVSHVFLDGGVGLSMTTENRD